ncbi:DUF1223 domain-containing protein [Hymenobacter sp. 15J16-1T3B]|uniref:DUF1223 domain-containing protein n=1 Tax=Hymenobacter sp. 15J16-1T3B TaxID=2886941 RepID=UPI001D11AD18|nr:DUF1223 domain-containing protein [Hymenobacter sp. 15J16-1T3B]MCC3158429.1 DUF1223 domain-containing protein [Hymenobacter sp. 15J16-1T3B]
MNNLFLALPVIPAASAALLCTQVAYAPPVSRPAATWAVPTAGTPRVPVVVELFTSEGCSSCPAADEALRELGAAQAVAGVEIIALGQHVDYWNRLGWRDPFSSPQFTARQRWYAEHFAEGNYTPQAVVNGRYQLVGSQRRSLLSAITQAAQAPRATVTLARAAGSALRVQVSHLPSGTTSTRVALALTEAGLSSHVGRGENAGRLLQHAPLVRTWRTLGMVGADGTFATTAPLDLEENWQVNNLRVVVLVQEIDSRRVVGAASLALASGQATR